jgi:hypothetical protein
MDKENTTDFVVVNEYDYGLSKIINDLEESYVASCEHNRTTTEDIHYFRRYVFTNIALIIKELRFLNGTKKA